MKMSRRGWLMQLARMELEVPILISSILWGPSATHSLTLFLSHSSESAGFQLQWWCWRTLERVSSSPYLNWPQSFSFRSPWIVLIPLHIHCSPHSPRYEIALFKMQRLIRIKYNQNHCFYQISFASGRRLALLNERKMKD